MFRLLLTFIISIILLVPSYSQTNEFQYNYKLYETKEVEVCFSPKGNCQNIIIKHIDDAKRYIYLAIYSFTDKDIAAALVRARKRGIDVKVLMYSTGNRTVYHYLLINDIDVKKYHGYGLMHNKFIIIDGKYIGTGSYNYTYSARSRNSENLLFLNDKFIVNTYLNYFIYLWFNSNRK